MIYERNEIDGTSSKFKICFTEDPVKRLKREDKEMEKTVENHMLNKTSK